MNTQIPMPVNGISTPFSIDENIAKMKQTLLKIFNVQLTFIVWTVAVVMGVKSKFSVPLRQRSMRNVLVLKWWLHLVTRTFYYSLVRLPRAMRTPAMRAYQAAPDPKICISYGACGCGGGISMIFIVFGVVVIKSYQSMCTYLAVLRPLQRQFMDSR